jgi:hypothetical protein
MSIASSSSSVKEDQKGKLRCWSKGSENLQQQFCMAFTVDFTVYNFQIAHNERRWFVQKRYSEFDKLDSVVSLQWTRDAFLAACKLPLRSTTSPVGLFLTEMGPDKHHGRS